jgi:hypothetical protein
MPMETPATNAPSSFIETALQPSFQIAKHKTKCSGTKESQDIFRKGGLARLLQSLSFFTFDLALNFYSQTFSDSSHCGNVCLLVLVLGLSGSLDRHLSLYAVQKVPVSEKELQIVADQIGWTRQSKWRKMLIYPLGRIGLSTNRSTDGWRNSGPRTSGA